MFSGSGFSLREHLKQERRCWTCVLQPLMAARWDAGSPLTIPPSDAEQRRVIEKLAEYCARNGSAFEAVVKRNEAGNPHFRFLSSPNSAEAGYYQHLLNVERDRAARQNSSYHLREGSAPPPPPRPPPHPPPHVQRPPSVPPPPPAADPHLPAGLLPALARTANTRGSALATRAYSPIDSSEIPRAKARDAAATSASGAVELDDYLRGRLERFAQDLADGGRSRLDKRDREREKLAMASGEIISGQGSGFVPMPAKVWRVGGSGGGGGGSGGDDHGRGGEERKGLGAKRAEMEMAGGDEYAAFRAQRSGSYHGAIARGRGR